MSKVQWPRRAEFVNLVLAWGVGNQSILLEDTEFDGVVRTNFFDIARRGEDSAGIADELIGMALKLGVPVEGLVADGTLGDKWAEVVALCKEVDATEATPVNQDEVPTESM